MNRLAQRSILVVAVSICLFSILVGYARSEINSWVEMAPMPTPRYGLGLAVVNGNIYAIGGRNSTSVLGTNEMYNPNTNTWTSQAPMPTPRSFFGITVYQNKIYCMGGFLRMDSPYGSTIVAGANEVYDTVTNSWKNGTAMPTSSAYMQANTVNGRIYVVGGGIWLNQNSFTPYNNNEAYDPLTDTWSEKAAIPNAVGLYASAVVGNNIYVFGGTPDAQSSGSDYNQVYNTNTDTWTIGRALPTFNGYKDRMGMAACAVNDVAGSSRIYVVGGFYANGLIDSNVVYNVGNDTWTTAESLPSARAELGLAFVNNNIFAIGGTNNAAIALNELYSPFGTSAMPAISSTPIISSTPQSITSPTSIFSPSPTIPEMFSLPAFAVLIAIAAICIMLAIAKFRRGKRASPTLSFCKTHSL